MQIHTHHNHLAVGHFDEKGRRLRERPLVLAFDRLGSVPFEEECLNFDISPGRKDLEIVCYLHWMEGIRA